jgi:hypothetical protein
MKALTLTQPWATLVAIGAKKIETRGWNTLHRGPVAIHAAKTFPEEAARLCLRRPFMDALTGAGVTGVDMLPLGAIVAVANLQHVCPTEAFARYPRSLTDQERAFGDYSPRRFAWMLTNVRPLREPVPCRGALGLWRVPDEVAARVREMVA